MEVEVEVEETLPCHLPCIAAFFVLLLLLLLLLYSYSYSYSLVLVLVLDRFTRTRPQSIDRRPRSRAARATQS